MGGDNPVPGKEGKLNLHAQPTQSSFGGLGLLVIKTVESVLPWPIITACDVRDKWWCSYKFCEISSNKRLPFAISFVSCRCNISL